MTTETQPRYTTDSFPVGDGTTERRCSAQTIPQLRARLKQNSRHINPNRKLVVWEQHPDGHVFQAGLISLGGFSAYKQ